MNINKIYCENNLDTMKRMPNRFIDLTVTSPPYDNLRTYNGYSFDFEAVARELYRVTKQGGVVVWVVGDATINGSESGTSFKQALYFKEIGFNLHDTMIYWTDKPPQNSSRYEPEFEYMFVLSKGGPKTFNPIKRIRKYEDKRKAKGYHRTADGKMIAKEKTNVRECTIGNIWHYNTGGGLTTPDQVAFEHPAIFPERLAYDHIISWSNEGDLVYDPFMGSGTTAKAAICANRNYIGSEISAEYCEIIEKRLHPLKHNLFT
jgi:DNA modification methylase